MDNPYQSPADEQSLAIFKPIFSYFFLFCIAIIYYELLLRITMTGQITGNFLFFLCFVPCQALVLTVLSGWFKSKGNIFTTCLWLLVMSLYYAIQLIYYRNFGSLFSVSMIGMGGEALGNFGWAILDTIKGAWWLILLMMLPPVLSIILSVVKVVPQKNIHFIARLVVFLLIIPVWLLGIGLTRLDGNSHQSAYVVFYDSLSDTDTSAAHLGALTTTILESGSSFFDISASGNTALTYVDVNEILVEAETIAPVIEKQSDPVTKATEVEAETFKRIPHVLNALDFNNLIANAPDSETSELAYYLGSRNVSYTNEYTGLFEGYNLIYICGEAFSSLALDETLTPTLYKMAHEGIVLNNYYNSFKNTTTNGEFAFCTSLWPDFSRKADAGTDVGSFYQSATCYMPLGLGDFFNSIGANSYGYHNYYGEYYRRVLSWPNLGYTCKFMARGMQFTSSWPSSDLEMMEQSVDDYINDDQFHAYYMTFSGHGPYSTANAIYRKNIDEVMACKGEGLTQDAYGYLAGNCELDKAMEYLLSRLEEAGKLENTVIVLAGDHYPYNLSDKGRDQLAGYTMDTAFDIYKSNCIIYNAGLDEPIVSDTYCCNVDILPTILNLFGINYDSRLFMGQDIFGDGIHKAVLYNKSFVTDMVRYNSETGETVWTGLADKYTDAIRERYLNSMIDLITSEYSASLKILSQNFYEYAWYQSGLLSDEELAAEKARVTQVKQKDEQYNIQDAKANAAQIEEINKQAQPEETPPIEPEKVPTDANTISETMAAPEAPATPEPTT